MITINKKQYEINYTTYANSFNSFEITFDSLDSDEDSLTVYAKVENIKIERFSGSRDEPPHMELEYEIDIEQVTDVYMNVYKYSEQERQDITDLLFNLLYQELDQLAIENE